VPDHGYSAKHSNIANVSPLFLTLSLSSHALPPLLSTPPRLRRCALAHRAPTLGRSLDLAHRRAISRRDLASPAAVPLACARRACAGASVPLAVPLARARRAPRRAPRPRPRPPCPSPCPSPSPAPATPLVVPPQRPRRSPAVPSPATRRLARDQISKVIACFMFYVYDLYEIIRFNIELIIYVYD
jgi:hypothetical protein